MPSIFEGNEGNEGNIGNAGNAFAVAGGWYFADRINLPLVTEFDTGPNATPVNTIGKFRNNQRRYLGNLCKSQLQLSYNVWRGGLLHWVGG